MKKNLLHNIHNNDNKIKAKSKLRMKLVEKNSNSFFKHLLVKFCIVVIYFLKISGKFNNFLIEKITKFRKTTKKIF